MKTEIEVKFLNIDHDAMREKLRAIGGVCERPMRRMSRVTIDSPAMTEHNAFLRVRDEGHRVTMTYKQFDALSVDGAKEVEVIVEDFDKTIRILQAAGLSSDSFQESKRETWRVGDAEVVLDEWPWLYPYMEIEAGSETCLKEAASMLDLDWSEAVFGDVMVAYRAQYPHLTEKDTVGRIAEVKFGLPLPDLLKP
jgi:adenylate cyclase class 2